MFARAVMPALAIVVVLANSISAAVGVLHTDSGDVKIWTSNSTAWVPVKDSVSVESGDSVTTAEKSHAVIAVGPNTTLKIRGATLLTMSAKDSGAVVNLVRGQIFLYRVHGESESAIMMMNGDCRFVPVGTAAALRTGRNGEPIVAVIQGKIRAEIPGGQSFEVTPGMQGTFDPATQAFKVAELPAAAIASLEQWSGVALEQAAPPAAAQTTPAPAAAPPSPPPAPVAQAAQPAAAAPAAPAADTSAKQPAADTTKKTAAPGNPPEAGKEKPSFALSAGSVTVDGRQWTRVAFGVDVPIWKFGIFLDLEVFLDSNGQFSNKGWQFDKDNWLPSVTRKIRYLRFGHESEPVFVKVGGLENVTLGYGFVVDRFTNMLHYPDQKLLGLQFYLNDISPIGVTLQTVCADLLDFKDNGGVLAGRLGVKPLKMTAIPLLKDLQIAGTWAGDLNQYAPAHEWSYGGVLWDKNANNLVDRDYAKQTMDPADWYIMNKYMYPRGPYDTTDTYPVIDTTFRDSSDAFSVIGADAGIPIIQTTLVHLDLYGQAGASYNYDSKTSDKIKGWGFGAPGLKLTVGPFWLQAEYRRIHNQFMPGYFGPYYLDERVVRYPTPSDKEATLVSFADQNVNGVFGNAGCDIANVLDVSATYQYLISTDKVEDQSFEVTAGIADALVKKIPKLSKLEGYMYKTNIGRTVVYDKDGVKLTDKDLFFDLTPNFYYGYRLGFAITQGASLIWDARYGFKYDENHRRVPNNNVSIETAITF
jgi:hypothetical protein